MTTTTNNANKTLGTGTLVINAEDGESGRVCRINQFRRSGLRAWTYLVRTAQGFEIWDASQTIKVD